MKVLRFVLLNLWLIVGVVIEMLQRAARQRVCPHCQGLLWPWQHRIRLPWNYGRQLRLFHVTCALDFHFEVRS